jgi:MbtH protein
MEGRDGGTLDDATYAVVLNDEDQYSVWDVRRSVPPGWREAGFRGTYDDCIAHIETVWTDMRPRSLREAMRDDA